MKEVHKETKSYGKNIPWYNIRIVSTMEPLNTKFKISSRLARVIANSSTEILADIIKRACKRLNIDPDKLSNVSTRVPLTSSVRTHPLYW